MGIADVNDAFDVVVVGGGGSGLSAAVHAAAAGARVLLLEKTDHVGGSTGLSVGAYSAAGTSLQRRVGIDDSPRSFVEDMRTANGDLEPLDNAELRVILAEDSAPVFEWLRSIGVQFFGPTPDPPFRNARMHNVVPNPRAYIAALRREAQRHHVTILTGVRAKELLLERRQVVGVRSSNATFTAKAVILAAGDYSGNSAWLREHVSDGAGQLSPINPTNTGDGIAMATKVGAATRNMQFAIDDLRFPPVPGVDIVKSLPHVGPAPLFMRLAIEHLPRGLLRWFARRALTTWIAPSRELYASGAILVNKKGHRFTDELAQPAPATAQQPGNCAYVVFDASVAEKFRAWPHPLSTFPGVAYAYLQDYEGLRPDITFKADSLSSLATRIKVPPGPFEAAVHEYNSSVVAERDEPFGRSKFGPPLVRQPFYALGPLSGVVVLTEGGLVVDRHCRVLSEDGAVIPGLYAAGSNGQAGLLLKNHGLHIAWAMVSGRVAGRHAATAGST